MSRTWRQRIGDDGEASAAHYLRTQGFTILARDVRYGRMGQLDLVAARHGRLWAVEVKSRRDRAAYGGALYGITAPQQRRITACLLRYGRACRWSGGYGLLLVTVCHDGATGRCEVLRCEELSPGRVL